MGSSLRGGPHGLQRHAVPTVTGFVFSLRTSTRVSVLGVAWSRTDPPNFFQRGQTNLSWTVQTNFSRTVQTNFSRTDPTNLESKLVGQINHCA